MSTEHRADKRLNLDTLNLFNLCPGADQCLTVAVSNVSVSGLRAEFLSEDPPEALVPGDTVVVREAPKDVVEVAALVRDVVVEPCPKRLCNIMCGMHAEVVWIRDGQCGLHFIRPLQLSTRKLKEELARYGLPLWVEESLEQEAHHGGDEE
jgi:hypothetical protein